MSSILALLGDGGSTLEPIITDVHPIDEAEAVYEASPRRGRAGDALPVPRGRESAQQAPMPAARAEARPPRDRPRGSASSGRQLRVDDAPPHLARLDGVELVES
jgi:hypothetical protein